MSGPRSPRNAAGSAQAQTATATVSAALAAPGISLSLSASGRTVTITPSATGAPAPTVTLTALTLGGVDVLGDQTGAGPWTYEVPSSASLSTVAASVSATNGVGSDASDSVAGLSISSAGSITGTPTTPGSYTLVVRGTNSGGFWIQRVTSPSRQRRATSPSPPSGRSTTMQRRVVCPPGRPLRKWRRYAAHRGDRSTSATSSRSAATT